MNPGVAYRKSKSMADRDEDNRGPDAGTKVTGLRDGGWIVVDVSGVGKRFLPMEHNGDVIFERISSVDVQVAPRPIFMLEVFF